MGSVVGWPRFELLSLFVYVQVDGLPPIRPTFVYNLYNNICLPRLSSRILVPSLLAIRLAALLLGPRSSLRSWASLARSSRRTYMATESTYQVAMYSRTPYGT